MTRVALVLVVTVAAGCFDWETLRRPLDEGPDLSTESDLGAPDLSVGGDLSLVVDLASPSTDLAFADLAPVVDLTPPADLTPACDTNFVLLNPVFYVSKTGSATGRGRRAIR
jgi:hypothetical protein